MTSILCDIPCKTCIVYAACRSKPLIKCSILYNHFRSEYGNPVEHLSPHKTSAIKERMLLNDYIVYLDKFHIVVDNLINQIYLYD
jgi:hypothetical protein